MIEKPLISVLMPVRNEEKHVVDAIRSVLSQGCAVEVLVIDGCSSDETVSRVECLLDPRVTVIANPARLIPNALNLGLELARGDFVARVDAHARIADGYFLTALAVLSSKALAGVGGTKVGVATSSQGLAIAAALSSRFGVGNSVYHYGKDSVDTDHASFGVYRTSVARQVGGWDENLAVNEDVDFDHRILAAGWRIRYEPGMIVRWQVPESMGAFGRQYRRYGRGKAAMLLKNRFSAIRVRHLMPPALVLVSSLSLLLGVRGHRKSALALMAPYVAAVAAATEVTLRSEKKRVALSPVNVVSAFVTMHFAWGWGMIEGLMFRLRPAEASAVDPDEPVGALVAL